MLTRIGGKVYISEADAAENGRCFVLCLRHDGRLFFSANATFGEVAAHNCTCIYFDPNKLSVFNSHEYNLLGLFGGEYTGSLNSDGFIREAFRQIINGENTPGQDVIALSLVMQIIVRTNNIMQANKAAEAAETLENNESTSKKENPKINDIINYIAANINRKITLTELGKKFYINKYYLCHLFKNVTGRTITGYIAHEKITAAKKLLGENLTPSNVCEQLGFDDYSNFYRLFKKLTGMSPREYQASIKS